MYTAMIVDDEPLILKGLEKVISWEEFGIEITDKAESGEQALDILQKKEIDILITDIRMHGMSGLELLRAIREMGKHTKVIILSGYDDFQYVKKASQYGIENYLLKPIEESELIETLLHLIKKLDNEREQQVSVNESYQILRNNILSRWINGDISEEELTARSEFLNFPVDREWYQIAILQPRYMEQSAELDTIYHMISTFESEGLIAFMNWQNQGILLLFWDGKEDDSGQRVSRIRDFQKALSSVLHQAVFVAVAAARKGWESVTEGFQAAEKLLEYRLVLPQNSLISEEQINQKIISSAIGKMDFHSLEILIHAGDLDGAKRFLEKAFTNLSATETPKTIRILASEILLEMSKDFEGGRKQLFAGYLKEIFYSVDMNQLISQLEKCVEMVIGWRQNFYQDKNPVVVATLNYIHAHYDEEMSLKGFALKYKINAAYLGQLFKNEVGEMFSEYLCRVRIEKAEELLRTTAMKSNEISKCVGFGNPNYFSNSFKKITGQYPSEYRTMFHVSEKHEESQE